jgi:hypothetical protein
MLCPAAADRRTPVSHDWLLSNCRNADTQPVILRPGLRSTRSQVAAIRTLLWRISDMSPSPSTAPSSTSFRSRENSSMSPTW